MLWIKKVKVIDPSQKLSAVRDVLVKDNQVIKIADGLTDQEAAALLQTEDTGKITQIDGEGKYLFPGLIDVHVHLREPGREDKEDIASGSRAAVRGGFTSVIAMANTDPIIDQRGLVEFVITQGKRAGMAKVYPAAAVTKGFLGEELVEMVDCQNGGAVAFSDDGKGIQNARIMRLALEYAKLTGCPIISHCEDNGLASKGVMRLGNTSARLGLAGIPPSAESVMIARDIILAGETGGKLHIAHVSTKESVMLIRKAKKSGLDVTAEVNPHHLLFTDQDVNLTDTSLKVNPPLPSREDQEALLEGLADGTIDMLATDHAPHTWEEKTRPFAEAPFGINGLETSLAAVWQGLVVTGKLSAEKVVELWSLNPARRFKIAGGSLQPGSPADIVLFDPLYKEIIRPETMESKSQNTPFLDRELQGFPVMVWVGGKMVMKNRTVLKA